MKATLLPGDSGGPVLNSAAEVVVICVGRGKTKSSGYIIPSDHLKSLLKEMSSQEKSLVEWRKEPLIHAYAILKQGDQRMALGDTKDAIAAYDTAVCLKPDFAAAYAQRGLAKYKLGDYKGAIVDHDTAIRFGLDYATTYINRGVARRNLRDYSGLSRIVVPLFVSTRKVSKRILTAEMQSWIWKTIRWRSRTTLW